MKSNYWSCSKFADWLRGTLKLTAGTAEEWNTWKKVAKAKKIRYWLAEAGLDYLQNFLYWPVNRINDVRCYINNRWIFKKHALTSNLKRGQWHEFDTRLLHAIFDELINFVEIEQAWMQIICSDEERKRYKIPKYRTIFRLGLWRCPEAGVAYLEWAAGLKNDEDWLDKKDPSFGQATAQALAAQETLALYKWWKEERPKRPDPSEVSSWSDYCEKRRKTAEASGNDPLWGSFIVNKEAECARDILENYRKLEKEQEEEDTAMLIRLIKMRRDLWT